MSAAPPVATSYADAGPVGRFRWAICGLLFAANVFNYIDRQMIGVLKPTLQQDLAWSETDYAGIVLWFQAAYGISYLAFGHFIDKVGAKIGYALAFSIWTIGHMSHALARTALQFTLVRMLLGVGEGGSFPAGLKAIADWFPKSERALAIGFFIAGTNIGAIATPLLIPLITLRWGWRAAFVLTGLASLFWLAAWLRVYHSPHQDPRLGSAEAAQIAADRSDPSRLIPWRRLILSREAWAYALAKFLIDPVWWMFLFWLPDFFAKRHHLDLKSFGPPLIAIYVVSDLGGIGGGWFSSALMKRGWSLNAARKTAMLVAALAILPISVAAHVDTLWLAVAILALATAAHQWFSCTLFALPADVFPGGAVASVAGIGGIAGAIGGMVMAHYVGAVLQRIGDYTPIFVVAASVYLLALLLTQLLVPHYRMARV
jgi:ACS family hexuronate transporter-like MFS transporter